jgi:uncharacterized protein (TIGR00645 family)
MLKSLEAVIIGALSASRWLIAPIYLGLLAALILLGVEFFEELARAAVDLATLNNDGVILAVLKLIDLVLVANLVLVMISAGVGRFRPETMGRDSSSGLHLKAVALLIAIAAIDLLESFVGIGSVSKIDIEWRIAILATFVLTGILLAWMDRLATKSNEQEGFHNGPAVQ